MILENVLLVSPTEREFVCDIEIENGMIVNIKKKDTSWKYILFPGFVDTHTHGYMGIDCMYASSKDFENWASLLEKEGVTYLFPTTVSASKDSIEKVIYEFKNAKHPSLSGIHLEGPFINKEKAGAQNKEFITSFSREKLPKNLDSVKIITAAPEIEGFEKLYSFSLHKKIKLSIGHSNAKFNEFKFWYNKGINRITHFPNALSQFHHREVGAIGAAILLDFYVELIVDGIHLSPEFVKFVYKTIGPSRIILITDSISAAGLSDGRYDLFGLEVNFKNNEARLSNGTLAGSTLTFSNAVKKFAKITGCSLHELSLVSSYNALKNLGYEIKIQPGERAKFVLVDQDLNIVKTII